MNKILAFDGELGLVTVEPGVTYRQLYAFLKKEKAAFMAPVFGNGPHCSLIGNALDRGHSTTPAIDRFATLYALEAVLPNGSLYQSSNGSFAAQAFYKWGTGPYLDGLFVQSNLGIVTGATFKLTPRPASIEAVLGNISDEASLAECIDTLRGLHRQLGSLMPSVKLYNPQRILFSTAAYPKEGEREQSIAPQPFIAAALKDIAFTHWTLLGSLYGERSLVASSRSIIKRELRPYVRHLIFFNRKTLLALRVVPRYLLTPSLRKLKKVLPLLRALLWSVDGGEGAVRAPQLLLWRLPHPLADTLGPLEFDTIPQCGFIFFSGIFPMKGEIIAPFASQAEQVCRDHSIEPIIAMYGMSETSMVVTIYILFDKENDAAQRDANSCYTSLYSMAREHGGYVHRVPADRMGKVIDSTTPFWRLASHIKKSLDPDGVIAPGRYIPK